MAPREIKYLLKLGAFAAPIALVLLFPLWVLWKSGELMPDNVIAARAAVPSGAAMLVGMAYTDPSDYLGLQSILANKPDILVVGTSRIGQIRSTFFKPGTSSYLFSHFQRIGYFRHLLEKISDGSLPRILVVDMDQKFFDPAYNPVSQDNVDALLTEPFGASDVLVNWMTVYTDYAKGKFTVAGLIQAPSSDVGLAAIAQDSGYRADGSHQMGTLVSSPANLASTDYQFQSTLSQIAQGVAGFEHSNTVSQPALGELNALLAECRARNVTVIGFMPPFAPEVYQKLVSLPDEYGYLRSLPDDVNAVFKNNSSSFYDFMDPRSLGITDAEMADGTHTTERGSLMMFLGMASHDPELRNYMDITFLRNVLASSTKQYDLITN
jgi:hypothetical protein